MKGTEEKTVVIKTIEEDIGSKNLSSPSQFLRRPQESTCSIVFSPCADKESTLCS